MIYSKPDLSNIDWDFSDLGNEGIHGFHWYPGGFVAAIPGSIIPLLSQKDSVVVDPFCGMGTTGVEALRLGRRFIGFDINPIATLITRSKLLLPHTQNLTDSFLQNSELVLFNYPTHPVYIYHPNEATLKSWYHPQTYTELLMLLQRIRSIKNSDEGTAAQAIFSSILKNTSSQSRHYGWVCDNVKPKPEEIVYKNANEIFFDSLQAYIKGVEILRTDIRVRGGEESNEGLRKRWNVKCADAIEQLSLLRQHSVDLILTSPPYYGVVDYIKSQRLSFLWFHKEVLAVEGYSMEDFGELRHKEVGSRSYRARRTSHQEYIDYMRRFMLAAKQVLKKDGVMCLVLGESTSRNSTSGEIHDFAVQAGFRLDFSTTRSINSSKRRIAGRVTTEVITVYILN